MQSIDGRNKPDMEMMEKAQREADIQIKVVNAAISAYAVDSKNKRAIKDFEKMGLMEPTTTIDLMIGDPEMDKVKCPVKGIILRHDCLDYSGSHYEDCASCEIGKATKEKLLPNHQ